MTGMGLLIVYPGVPVSTIKQVISPRIPIGPSSVRTNTVAKSETLAWEIQVLLPLITHPLLVFLARVRMALAGSDPPEGSVMAKQPRRVDWTQGLRYFSFWASVGGPEWGGGGATRARYVCLPDAPYTAVHDRQSSSQARKAAPEVAKASASASRQPWRSGSPAAVHAREDSTL